MATTNTTAADGSVTYRYSITAMPVGKVEPSFLDRTVRAALPVLMHVGTSGDDLNVVFSRQLNGTEQTQLDAIVAEHPGDDPTSKALHTERAYDQRGRLTRSTQWRLRAADGAFSLKAQETTYEYGGTRLLTRTEVDYALDGSETSRRVWAYESGSKVLVEEQK